MFFGIAIAIGALVGFVLWGAAARWGAAPGRAGGPGPAGAWTLLFGAAAAVALGAAVLLAMRPDTSPRTDATPFLLALMLAVATLGAGVGALRAGVRDGRLWVGLVLGGTVFGFLAAFLMGDLLVG